MFVNGSHTLTGEALIHTKAANEMLIRRQLNTLEKLVDEYSLSIDDMLVKSNENQADKLTRVPAEMAQHKKRD